MFQNANQLWLATVVVLVFSCILYTIYTTPLRETFDEQARYSRNANTMYSGDIIKISMYKLSPPRFLRRSANNSTLLMDKADAKWDSNLSKLRFQNKSHDAMSTTPLTYGSPVNLLHNANVGNRSKAMYVKISDNLLSHQTGTMFRDFVILSANQSNSNNHVQANSPIVLQNLQSGNISSGYLVVDPATGKISNSAATLENATKFNISLQRPFEIGDKHLCTCNGDLMFP